MKYAILIILILALTACQDYEIVEKSNQEANTKDILETASNKEIKDTTNEEPEEIVVETKKDKKSNNNDDEVKPKLSLKTPLDEIKKLELEDINFENLDIVVGDNAPAEDVISASNIALVTGSKTILASEADNIEYIFVGSPCVNDKMAELIDFFNEDLCDGYEYPLNFKGTIFQVDDNIIIWGKTSAYTRELSEMIQDIDGELVVI